MFSVRRFWKVFRPPHEICRYTTIKHRADVSNPKNNQRSVCKVLSLPSLSLSLSLSACFFHEITSAVALSERCLWSYACTHSVFWPTWLRTHCIPRSGLLGLLYQCRRYSQYIAFCHFHSIYLQSNSIQFTVCRRLICGHQWHQGRSQTSI